jgi:hypothetical protein
VISQLPEQLPFCFSISTQSSLTRFSYFDAAFSGLNFLVRCRLDTVEQLIPAQSRSNSCYIKAFKIEPDLRTSLNIKNLDET